MTKKQLIDEMKELDDDAEIHILCTSDELCGDGRYADEIYFDDKVTGNDVMNELTLVAVF
ncbi:hypothetical protein [Treponema pectinovorum]|uniref:hypothetical protein n=1 Tax=Treponema pectinovorum TaxID=164 RepID=UPI0011F1E1AC|nr:hypothetical protein [Treponema pectinovorum]